MSTVRHGLVGLVFCAAIGVAPGPAAAQPAEPAHHVPSTPENVVWGWFPIDREPVLTIRSGETVRIDTLTHAGATQAEDPERYLNQFGVSPEEILQDVIDFWLTRGDRPREGRSAHVITGPIYIEDAELGDMLEVQILSIETRVPYGINNTSATSGVFSPDYPGSSPGDEPMDMEPVRHFIRTAEVDGTEMALFADSIRIPLAPFMGVMAVAPEAPTVGQPGVDVPGVQGSRPPGPFGGNLDVKDLVAGTTLYLPVFHPGARFYVGDPHSVQGDGEVSGTAIEQSLTGDFRFVLHKDRSIDGPRAENATHHILMGIDLDLDRALRKAVAATIDFLVEEYGVNRARAYSLASIAVDYRVAEAVDLTQVVTAFVPKAIFVDR
ncbi:MAG: amidase [Acidobacteria bacterium]|nr:amidase [Acidobacteriota bacterium]